VLHAAGIVLAAATLCLTTATSANAATGTLIVNGRGNADPSGCYSSDRWPLTVENSTNTPVTIFDSANCDGRRLDELPPGQSRTFEFGASVYVP
jgi:hypothetical protein